ncbi:OLC1v1018839C1 [Oldenlandia corymbosa var. corymbosa]|uniref:OLC1v1018839C1 n=1 Tax=Oldenlandia corymbosa var. corymbosa TaxID=529605 RepID=A0AAV1ECX8_OLDCO|nr:OLC1v1018839C1 [Oldenlandia corymbosa var. corymbosa]
MQGYAGHHQLDASLDLSTICEHLKFSRQIFKSIFKFWMIIQTKLHTAYQNKLIGVINTSHPVKQAPLKTDSISNLQINGSCNIIKGNCYKEIVESYTKEVSKLEKTVMRMIFERSGVKEFHEQYYQSCSNFLALIKHRPPQSNEELGGVQEHTDPTFITLIQQNQISGFEIKSKDGSWISVGLPPSSFLVRAGDALLAWSNGRVRSTLHRVRRNSRETTRLSIALASYYNGMIQIPEELVDEEHPLKFKPFTTWDSFISLSRALQR